MWTRRLVAVLITSREPSGQSTSLLLVMRRIGEIHGVSKKLYEEVESTASENCSGVRRSMSGIRGMVMGVCGYVPTIRIQGCSTTFLKRHQTEVQS